MHLHILGICGTFMGGLAAIAKAAGHTVTGCDANVYPPMSTQLEAQGVKLIEGFSPDQLSLAPDVFVSCQALPPMISGLYPAKKSYPCASWLSGAYQQSDTACSRMADSL